MKIMIKTLVYVVLAGLLAGNALAGSEEHAAAVPARQMLLNKTVTLPGNTIASKVIQVKFPPAYKTPVHTHEGPGPRYVVKGRLQVVDNGETKVFSAGQVFWESGSAMTVENLGTSEAEIIIFEMAPSK